MLSRNIQRRKPLQNLGHPNPRRHKYNILNNLLNNKRKQTLHNGQHKRHNNARIHKRILNQH